jgi:hypothetical protein
MIFRGAIIVALLAVLGAGYQTLRLQIANASLDQLGRDLGQCQATLTAYLEGEEIDNAIPDDLRNYDPRNEWMRRLLPPDAAIP